MRPERRDEYHTVPFNPGDDIEYVSGGSRRFVVIWHDIKQHKMCVVTPWKDGLRKFIMDEKYFILSPTQSPIINSEYYTP